MTRLHRRALAWLAVALMLAAPVSAARAQVGNVDDETRATARAVAQEGLDFYDKGQYKEALARLEKANTLVSAPTLGLMIARCYQKLGRLVEASERYLDVSRTPLDAKASDLFRKSVADAAREREALMPQIPSVTIVVEGSGEAIVSIDGKPIPSAMIGLKRLINPGTHRIEVTRGDQRAAEEVTLKQGESQRVTLTPTKATEGVDAGGGAKASSSTPVQKIVGFVALGVGGAGLVVGAATAGVAAGQLSDLEAAGCVNGHCTRAQRAAVDEYNTMRVVSTVGFIAGASLAAGGIVLVLTAPKGKTKQKAGDAAAIINVHPVLGLGSAGLVGTF